MIKASGVAWTAEENSRLIELAKAGHVDDEVAEILGRPVRAISAQRMLHGIAPNRR